jgi:hypothetical protein
MDIHPAKTLRHSPAPATGLFGETCTSARAQGYIPDPQAFAARFIANGACTCNCSAHEHPAESGDRLRLVA